MSPLGFQVTISVCTMSNRNVQVKTSNYCLANFQLRDLNFISGTRELGCNYFNLYLKYCEHFLEFSKLSFLGSRFLLIWKMQ
jgi:hypothetical protein